MIKLKDFVFILIFCISGIACAQIQDSSSLNKTKPSLVFDSMEYNFGTIKSDTVLTHIFTFTNVCSDTIKINKVGTS